MKKTSIFTLLMVALGFAANAQTARYSASQVFDGMDSITVHYNPYGTGGGHGDTIFQTYTGPLYAYVYTTDSSAALGGGGNHYNDGAWASIDTLPAALVTMVSDTDWVWTLPSTRQFLSVPKDVYVTGINIILHTVTGDTQSANLSYAGGLTEMPVSESYALIGNGLAVSTGPVTNISTGTYLANGNENVAIYYHPQQDTFTSPTGDVLFKSPISGSLYSYTYIQASNGMTYQLTSWGSVGSTPADSMVEIDSNNFVVDVPNLVGDFMNAGLPSGVNIDTLVIIPRTASGDTQTANLYIPLEVSSAVAKINVNAASVSMYPNPATSAIFVAYSFAQPGNATLTINNMMGQTVMTQDLGNKQVGNMYLSVDNLASGVYLVTVTNGTSTSVQRLVKD